MAKQKMTVLIFPVLTLVIMLTFVNGDTLPYELSCENSCGDVKLGCSCNTKCMISKNCCEDFVTSCPGVVNKAREYYGHLMSAEYQCTKENVLVFSRCSKESTHYLTDRFSNGDKLEKLWSEFQKHSSGRFKHEVCWNSTMEYYFAMQSRLSELKTSEKLSEKYTNLKDEMELTTLSALAELYVSDITTGFVYANIDVFLCYAANTNSVPCVWQLYTSTQVEKPELSSIGIHGPFKQKFELPSSPGPSFCDLDAIEKCDENSTFFSEELQSKCGSFVSLVSTSQFSRDIYKNRFCLECNEGFKDVRKLVFIKNSTSRTNPLFSTLVHLTKSQVLLEVTNTGYRDHHAWRSASCDWKGNMSCTITKCNKNLMLENGECYNLYVIHLAVRVSKGVLNKHEHAKLANLLECLVQNHIARQLNVSTTVHTTQYTVGNTSLYGAAVYLQKDLDYGELQSFSRKFGVLLPSVLFSARSQKSTVDSGKLAMRITQLNDNEYEISPNSQQLPDSFMFCQCMTLKSDIGGCYLRCFNRLESDKVWQEDIEQLSKDTCVIGYLKQGSSTASRGIVSQWYGSRLILFTCILLTSLLYQVSDV